MGCVQSTDIDGPKKGSSTTTAKPIPSPHEGSLEESDPITELPSEANVSHKKTKKLRYYSFTPTIELMSPTQPPVPPTDAKEKDKLDFLSVYYEGKQVGIFQLLILIIQMCHGFFLSLTPDIPI